jgi:hypothetical protein
MSRKTIAALVAAEPEEVETPVVAPVEEQPLEEVPAPVEQEAAPEPAAATLQSGHVGIAVTELDAIRADAAQWQANKVAFENLQKWHANALAAGTSGADAADAAGRQPYKSKGQALAESYAAKIK